MFSYLETKRFYSYALLGTLAVLFGTAAIYTMYGMNPHIFFLMFAIVFAPIMWMITSYLYFQEMKKNSWESRMITAVVWVFIYLVVHFLIYGLFTGHIILETLSFAFIKFQWINLVAIVFAGFLADHYPIKK
jgi:hypothetical protein